MKPYRKFYLIPLIFAFLHLFPSLVSSQAQLPETAGQLQLFFYSPEAPSYFIVVEKKNQKLKLFEQNGSLKMLKEFNCATGEHPGNKKTSGDMRTPEGIYHITEIYEDKRITVFGSRAFHLNYPNAFDTQAGHLGDGIFIHGTNRKLNPNSTNGCIALSNGDLDELAPYLAINTTPVVILGTDSELSLGTNLLLEKDSTQFHDALDKLSFTPTEIPVENIKSLTYFKQQEQAIVSINYKIFEDKLTQYSERKKAYLTQSPSGNWRTLYAIQTQDTSPTLLAVRPTKNELVVKSNAGLKNNDMVTKTEEIVAKTNPPPQKPQPAIVKVTTPEEKNTSVVVKMKEPEKKTHQVANKPPVDSKNEELYSFVEKWRTAWANKDLETYMNCYSPSFKSGNQNKEEWRAKKSYLNQKYKFIAVQLHNIVIKWTETGANVSFHQTYRSDQLQTSGTKTLYLVNKKNRWMIENEMI